MYDGRDRSLADGRHGVRISKRDTKGDDSSFRCFLDRNYRSSSVQSLAAQAGSGVSYSQPGPQ